jgi:hypothetical protein
VFQMTMDMSRLCFFFTKIRSFHCSLLITGFVTRLTPVDPPPPPPAATDEFARFSTCFSGVHVVNDDTCIYVFMFLFPCCDVRYDFRLNTMLDSCVLTPIWFVGGSRLIMSIVFIYVC